MNFNFTWCKLSSTCTLRKGNLYHTSVRNIETAPSKKLPQTNESLNSDYRFQKFNTAVIRNSL